jgi:superfamily II DNA helicase RecQ
MVRSVTMRRDIYFHVSRCPPKRDFVREFAVPEIQDVIRSLAVDTRAIIYCSLRDIAEEVAQMIHCPVYHSRSGSVEEKAEVLQQWRAGEPSYIVATSAFGMSIDHPAVRWVVHVGVPWNAIDFAQEVGRLGRDGAGGQSIVLIPPQWKATTTDRHARPLDGAEAAMQSYIGTRGCRVLELSHFLDGDGRPCTGEARICDRCRDTTAVRLIARPAVGWRDA